VNAKVAARKTASGEAGYRLLHGAAFLALFCVGMYAGTFGPALPQFADDLGVSLDTAGLLLTTFFAGSIAASSLVAVALHARSSRLLGIAGLATIAAGALLLGLAPSWPAALAGGIVLGLGDGLVIAGLHILMSRTSENVPGAVNRLNLYFAFGAIAGPLWAGTVLDLSSARAPVYAAIAAVALTALVGLAAAGEPAPAAQSAGDDDEKLRLPSSPVTLVMGLVLFLYVGAEFGLGSWVSSYARESAHAGIFEAALLAAGFWLALAIGRIVTGVYFRERRDALALLLAAAAGAGVASLVLSLASGSVAAAAVCAFAAGLCMGPMWPTIVAIASEAGLAHDTAAVVTIGNAGGLVLPWAQGKVLVGAGPAQGVLVTAVLCGVMFVMLVGFRAWRRSAR
jgi:fucose permease